MGEFANALRVRAAGALWQISGQVPTVGTDPIVELLGYMLEDGAGGPLLHPDVPITTDEWLRWNQLALEQPTELIDTMTDVLENEKLALPVEIDAMRAWAAWLLSSTLDRIGML